MTSVGSSLSKIVSAHIHLAIATKPQVSNPHSASTSHRRPANGTYHRIVDEEWRVSIALDELPRAKRKSRVKSLLPALRARLGD